MKKNIYSLTLAAVLIAFCVSAGAQQPKKIPRIGILSPGSPGPNDFLFQLTEAMRQALRGLGYIEGQNIVFEYRFAEEKFDRLPQLAAELVKLDPDLIYTMTTLGALAAKKATTTIPIVIGAAGDLVQSGIVASLARPGGNITGLTFLSVELAGKRLELLKEAAPKISRVAVLLNPANPRNEANMKDLEEVARALGIRLLRVDARGHEDFEAAFAEATKGTANALWVSNDAIFTNHLKRIAELAAKHRLPSIHERTEFADAGGLMAYGPSLPDMHRRAATHVDKILKGAKPADIPVERPYKFQFVANLKTAKQIGFTFPPNLLVRVDRVIK